MSIKNQNTNLISPLRTFNPTYNTLRHIEGFFLIDDDVTIPTESDLEDFDYWFETLFKNGSILPFHGVKNVTINDEDTLTHLSIFDETFEIGAGKYRHSLSFFYSLELHQILETFTSVGKSIIYYDQNRNLILMEGYKGIPVSGFYVKKFEFPTVGKPSMSVVNIELKNSDDLSVNGVIKQVDWNPANIDRAFVTVNVLYTDSDTLNFEVLHNGSYVETLESSDIIVTDDSNGILEFITFNRTEGQYTITNFSSSVVKGTLKILDSFYLGCSSYVVTITVPIQNQWLLFDDDNLLGFDDDNLLILQTV